MENRSSRIEKFYNKAIDIARKGIIYKNPEVEAEDFAGYVLTSRIIPAIDKGKDDKYINYVIYKEKDQYLQKIINYKNTNKDFNDNIYYSIKSQTKPSITREKNRTIPPCEASLHLYDKKKCCWCNSNFYTLISKRYLNTNTCSKNCYEKVKRRKNRSYKQGRCCNRKCHIVYSKKSPSQKYCSKKCYIEQRQLNKYKKRNTAFEKIAESINTNIKILTRSEKRLLRKLIK